MFQSLPFDAQLILMWLAHTAWQAGLLAIVVFAMTWLLGSRLQPRWRFALWLIVFARFAAPILPESPWSVFQFVSLGSVPPAPGRGLDSALAMSFQNAGTQKNLSLANHSDEGGVAALTNSQSIQETGRSLPNGQTTLTSSKGCKLSLTQLAVLVWIAGVMVLALRRAASAVQLHRRQRHWQEITDPRILSLLKQCRGELRISRNVSLYVTPENLGPATCGVFDPRIILPQSVLDRLSQDELRLVILHELVHVRRHDLLVDQLVGFVTIVHWFHPIAWISRYCLRNERELACDAAVLAQSPSAQAADYGHVILKTIESLATPVAPFPGLVGMFGRSPLTLVHRRIHLIAAYRRSTWTGPLMGSVMIVGLGLVGLTDAQTKPPQPPPQPKPAPASRDLKPSTPQKPAVQAAGEKKEQDAPPFPITVSGRALGPGDNPISGAEIFLAAPRDIGQPLATTKTDADGNYRFEKIPFPITRPDANSGPETGSFEVFGRAPGWGFAWRPRKLFDPHSAHVEQRVDQFGIELTGDLPRQFGREDPITLDIHFGLPTTIRGRIVDEVGTPLANAKLAIRGGQLADGAESARELESFNWSSLVPEAVKVRRTDQDGRFEFTELPRNSKFRIDVRPVGHPPRMISASTVQGLEVDADNEKIYSGDFELVFPRPRKVKLHIIYGDTEQPAVKVGVGGSVNVAGFWETTDDQGNIEVPLPDGQYQLTISPRYRSAYLKTTFDLVVSAEKVQQPITVKLRPAAIVDITVVDIDTRQPLPGADVWIDDPIPGPAGSSRRVHGYRSWEVETRISHFEEHRTDKDGKMRVLFEPGEHLIGVALNSRPSWYTQTRPDGKMVNCQPGLPTALEFTMRRQAGAPPPAPAQENQPAKADETEPKPAAPATDSAVIAPQILQHPLTVSGKALDRNGKPIARATIFLAATNNSPHKLLAQTVTDRDGRYEFRSEQLPYYAPEKSSAYAHGTFQVFGKAPDLGFAWRGMRFLLIDPRLIGQDGRATVVSPSYGYVPSEAIELDLTFLPARPIRGRFVDDQGRPLRDVKVYLTNCDYHDTTGKETKESFREFRDAVKSARRAMSDQVQCVSDADGRFELKSVPEGLVCRLVMEHPEYGTWAIYTATTNILPATYDGAEVSPNPIEMTRQKTRSISVQVRYADTREPSVGALVGAYVRLGTNNAWGESDIRGKVELKLPPGEYTVWSNPPKGADYLNVDSKLIVKSTDTEQSAELILDRATVLVPTTSAGN